MTETEHAEISRRLALAIGWSQNDMKTDCGVVRCYGGREFVLDGGGAWRMFDYRDPLIAWSVAERFNCFPSMASTGTEWVAYTAGAKTTWADTAALAVALAVIKAKESK